MPAEKTGLMAPSESSGCDTFGGIRLVIHLNCCIMKMCHLFAFAGGVLAGGAIALMFAPKKGEELRRDLKNKLYDMKREIDETLVRCKDGHCRAEEKVDITIKE